MFSSILGIIDIIGGLIILNDFSLVIRFFLYSVIDMCPPKTFNCSAAYNFDKSYPDKWERYSLLHLLYKKIYETSFRKILLAPPKEVLKVFGGHMSITEYRKNLITNEKSFKIISPPIISIIPKIEENITMRIVQNNKFIPINQNLMDKASLSLRLKRDKPITENNNTLYSYMDLKVT